MIRSTFVRHHWSNMACLFPLVFLCFSHILIVVSAVNDDVIAKLTDGMKMVLNENQQMRSEVQKLVFENQNLRERVSQVEETRRTRRGEYYLSVSVLHRDGVVVGS